MCLTSGKNASTAACIFDKINEKFTQYDLPWEAIAIGSRFKQKSESCFYDGCPCYLAHIAASNANDAFSSTLDSL